MIARTFYADRRRFTRLAWFFLAYNVIIILSGAIVRATGSGAGCGSHWPTCNGQVIPTPEAIETVIEFSHRLLTGLALPLGALLLIGAWRLFPAAGRVRRAAGATIFFLLIEALIGAFLVRAELVADNASPARAIVDALHLGNTLLLLGAAALTAWWGGGRPGLLRRLPPGESAALAGGLVALVVVAMLGAATALGDTLFPAESLAAGLAADRDPTAHFLIRLRVWHPVAAVAAGVYLVALVRALGSPRTAVEGRLGRFVIGIVLLELIAGAVNVLLLVPLWLQLVHLALADALWISVVLWSAARLAQRETLPARPAAAAFSANDRLPASTSRERR